jgi:hypothetical protein
MTDVTLKATGSFYAGGIGHIAEGQEFSASEARARELEQAGLAARSGAKSDPAPDNKADPAPDNKMEPDALDTADDEPPKRSVGRPRRTKADEPDEPDDEA